MTTEVFRVTSLRSIQCDGGSVAAPANIPGVAICFNRCSNSASVSFCRVPKPAGRSNGVLISAAVDHTPCRSGSPRQRHDAGNRDRGGEEKETRSLHGRYPLYHGRAVAATVHVNR